MKKEPDSAAQEEKTAPHSPSAADSRLRAVFARNIPPYKRKVRRRPESDEPAAEQTENTEEVPEKEPSENKRKIVLPEKLRFRQKAQPEEEKPNTEDVSKPAAENKFSLKIPGILPNMREQIAGAFGPEDKYSVLAYQLLTYLNKALENGEKPDWGAITQDGEENTLLPVNEEYRIYVLEHLLADGYIEGFTVNKQRRSKKKELQETSGIQITPLGKKYLKENSAMSKAASLLMGIRGLF